MNINELLKEKVKIVYKKFLFFTVSLGFLLLHSSAWAVPFLVDPSVGTLQMIAQSNTTLHYIDGLTFDSFGNLFGTLEIIDSGGVVYIDKNNSNISSNATILITGISRADQIDIHPNGHLFVTSESGSESTTNRVYDISVSYDGTNTPVGASKTSLTTSQAINNPEGLVVLTENGVYGNAGDLMVAEDATSGRVFRVDPTGTTTTLVDTSTNLRRPEGLAFGDFNGALSPALYAAETSDNNILRIASDGGISVFGTPGDVSLSRPDNVEFSMDGFLYVSEDVVGDNGRIIRITSDGTHSIFAGGFQSPQGLAFDPFTGDMYISERETATIWRVSFASTPIPEPATIALLGIGLAGLGGRYFRKRIKRKK